MSIRYLILVAVAVWTTHQAAAAEGAPPDWVGLAQFDHRPRFVLADPASGATRWVAAGDRFEGYRVVAFDATRESLVVEKDATGTTLQLLGAHIESAPPGDTQLQELARAAVRRRDGWIGPMEASLPQAYGNLFRVVVKREPSEARLILLNRRGEVVDDWRV